LSGISGCAMTSKNLKDLFEDLGVYGKKIVKWMLKKQSMRVWNGLFG
jgi:hypothetical protein